MASNSGRKYGSSERSTRKRVVIGAEETVRVRYNKNQPQVESERRTTQRQSQRTTSKKPAASRRPAARAGKRLSTAKRDERNRRQQQIRLKRMGVLLAASVSILLLGWALVALYNMPFFAVDKVEVEGGRHLTDEQLITLARIPSDATLLRLPRSAIEARVAADPWVTAARVERDFPSTVRIVVEEREPAAVIDAGGTDLWVVSSDGFWLSERSAEDTGLVVVRDVSGVQPVAGERVGRNEVTNALRVVAGLSDELRSQVRVVSAPSIAQTALVTESEVEIFVGEADDIAEKDRVALEILRREQGKVVYINVRVVDRPTWRGL